MLAFFLPFGGVEERVSIPVGTYSFPEVAQMLSTKSERVDVAGDLSERGALVGLRDRPVLEALKIVCEGLDLQVSRTGKGHLRLEPNAKIESREQRWREALLANLSRRTQIQAESTIKFADAGRDELLARKQEFRAKYPFEGDVVSNSLTLTSGDAQLRAAAILASNAPFELTDKLIEKGDEMDEFHLQLSPDLVSAVQRRMSTNGQISQPFRVRRTLERDAGQLRLDSVIFANTATGDLASLQNPFSTVTVGNPSIARDGSRRLFHELVRSFPDFQVAGIGPDATAWLQSTERSTKEQLSRAHMGDSFELPKYEPSVSALVQKWATQSEQEVVMELAPTAESLNFTPYSSLPKAPKLSLEDLVLKDDSWCLDSAEGVLVVRNRMSFLDRQIPAPIAEIAHFARVESGRSGIDVNPYRFDQDEPPLPLVQDLIPLVRLREEAADYRRWFDWTGYDGLSDGYLQTRAIFLWPGIPGRALSQVRSELQGKISIPVGDFSEAAVDDVIESMLGQDAEPADLNRAYKEVLRANAEITWKRSSGNEILVRIILTNVTDETLQIGLASIFRIPAAQGNRA